MSAPTGLPDVADEAPFLDGVTATVETIDGVLHICGYVVRWGQAGTSSAGRLVYLHGSIELPSDLSRVKLLVEHQTRGPVIGYGATADVDDHGLHMRFAVPEPAFLAAKDALHGVEHKLRDSLSSGVELSDGTRLRLRRAQLAPARGNGRLREVSLVVVPGFDTWDAGGDDE